MRCPQRSAGRVTRGGWAERGGQPGSGGLFVRAVLAGTGYGRERTWVGGFRCRMLQRALQAVDSEPATVAACAAITATGTAYLLARLTAGTAPASKISTNTAAQDQQQAAATAVSSVPAYTGERKSAGQFEVFKVLDDGAAAPRLTLSTAEATPIQPRTLFNGKQAKEAAAMLRRNLAAGSPAAAAVREWTHNLDSMADYIESLEHENEQLRRIATPAAAADVHITLPQRSPSPLDRLARSTEDLEEERHRQARLEGELEAVSVEIQRVRSRLGLAGGSPAGG